MFCVHRNLLSGEVSVIKNTAQLIRSAVSEDAAVESAIPRSESVIKQTLVEPEIVHKTENRGNGKRKEMEIDSSDLPEAKRNAEVKFDDTKDEASETAIELKEEKVTE